MWRLFIPLFCPTSLQTVDQHRTSIEETSLICWVRGNSGPVSATIYLADSCKYNVTLCAPITTITVFIFTCTSNSGFGGEILTIIARLVIPKCEYVYLLEVVGRGIWKYMRQRFMGYTFKPTCFVASLANTFQQFCQCLIIMIMQNSSWISHDLNSSFILSSFLLSLNKIVWKITPLHKASRISLTITCILESPYGYY